MTRVALLLAFAAAACATDEPACVNPEPGVAEVGAGDLSTGFIELGDGDDVLVELGPQGLHMVVVSGRVYGFEMPVGERIHVEVALRDNGDVVGGTVVDIEPSSFAGDGAMELLGLRAVFTVAEVRDLAGDMVDLELAVIDGCGRELDATRRVRLTM